MQLSAIPPRAAWRDEARGGATIWVRVDVVEVCRNGMERHRISRVRRTGIGILTPKPSDSRFFAGTVLRYRISGGRRNGMEWQRKLQLVRNGMQRHRIFGRLLVQCFSPNLFKSGQVAFFCARHDRSSTDANIMESSASDCLLNQGLCCQDFFLVVTESARAHSYYSVSRHRYSNFNISLVVQCTEECLGHFLCISEYFVYFSVCLRVQER